MFWGWLYIYHAYFLRVMLYWNCNVRIMISKGIIVVQPLKHEGKYIAECL